MSKERRVKVAFVDQYNLIGCFQRARQGDQIKLMKIKGLPDDAVVERMFYSESRMAIGFLFSHPSFPIVKPTEEPPILYDQGIEVYYQPFNKQYLTEKVAYIVDRIIANDIPLNGLNYKEALFNFIYDHIQER